MHGAVTVTLDGGGGAALMTGMVLDDRGVDGDGGFVMGTILADREIGGDGGLVTGGLRTRFIVGLAVGCGMIVSIRQSCD